MRRAFFTTMLASTSALVLIIAACSSDDKSSGGATVVDAGLPDVTPPVFRPRSEAGAIQDVRFGKEGAPTTCTGKPSPNADLVRACVLRTGCIPDQPPYKISDCITYDLIKGEDEAACVRSASSCQEMNGCLDQGFFYGKDCESGDYGDHCYDDLLVSCSGNPRSFRDCAKTGRQCVQDEKGDGSVSTFGCVGFGYTPFDSCPQSGDSNYRERSLSFCYASGSNDGGLDSIAYCQFGGILLDDCASLGKECVELPTGPECRKPAPTCAGAAGATCAGSVLTRCDEAHRLDTHDCKDQGMNCVTENDKADCVLPSCTQSTASECTESCDGPFANVCVGGGRLTVDCRDYGFTRCQAYTSSDPRNHGDLAVCVYF